jgi:hypothetical protein
MTKKMSIQAAKEELNSLTEFQRDIHRTSNMSESIISTFYREFIRSTWYSSIPMKLKCSTDDTETLYSVNNTFHYLMYTYLRFMSPPVRVKPEYKGRVRIAWCHNLGTNIIKQAIFKEDDDTYQKWDNVWADVYFQFYQDGGAGKRDNHNIGIGNVKCMEDWCEYLPPYQINVDQPWFYSMDPALSFPIFYKHSQTRAEHRYTFRRKVMDLLRIQMLSRDGTWKDIPKSGHKYLDINQSACIKTPELWGRYAYITEPEIKWYKCSKTRTLYTRDVEICDTQNPNKYNSIAEIPLHCTNPCLAFFWVAENKDSISNHNYSNYTTDINDLYSGWDPIKSTTLKYGTTTRLDDMDSDHFSIAEPRKHFPSAPSERGYHGYSFAWDSTSYHGDIGIVLSEMKAILHCKIANNNIFTNVSYTENEEDNEEDGDMVDSPEDIKQKKLSTHPKFFDEEDEQQITPSFITRARLLVVRKFTISSDDNQKYKFTIL